MKARKSKYTQYEVVVVLKPEINEDQEKAVCTRIEEIIKQFEGSVVKHENWGKKRLAYEIRKETRGRYLYWHYTALPAIVLEMERNLRLSDNVLRFLTIKLTARELRKMSVPAEKESGEIAGSKVEQSL